MEEKKEEILVLPEEEGAFRKALDFLYEKAVEGAGGLDGADTLAKQYLAKEGSLEDQVDSLILWQSMKSGGIGFLTGMGGIASLPLAIPSSLLSTLFIQMQMVAAIAIMGGEDPSKNRVKSFVFLCLLGNSAKDLVRELGINVSKKLATEGIKRVSSSFIQAINQKVGFRLLTKFGEKGLINLSRLIPIAGGLVAGGIDGFSTKGVGEVAKRVFILKNLEEENPEELPIPIVPEKP
ncbi:MAG: EcsC family protein [Leptospiraceae bacterium]|nr:EcsC family protein [Leptospiraceae bacterium]